MAVIDLEALSLSELKQLQRELEKQLVKHDHRLKTEARIKLEAYADQLGYSLSELFRHGGKGSRAPVAAKYRHPEEAGITWSGRGSKPRWFREALASGMTAEDLKID